MGYLDSNGLSYFWGKIKSYIAGLGYYTKPSGGIPASDIASGVIPTVPTTLSSFTDDLGSSPTHTHSQYLTAHQDISGKANIADLAAVATSGSYTDLDDKPTIPVVPSNLVTGSSQSYTIWSGTQAQYDALATKDNNTIYLIKEP